MKKDAKRRVKPMSVPCTATDLSKMQVSSLPILDSSPLYRELLDRVILESKSHEIDAMDSLVPLVKKIIEFREAEAFKETQKRWFVEFSFLVDKRGATSVLKALTKVMEDSPDRDLYEQVHHVIRDACMRHETSVDGRRYDAHLMMIPLIFRGGLPSRFSKCIDLVSADALQTALANVFKNSVPHGNDAIIIPGDVLYTLDEFTEERVDFFHGLLATVVKIINDLPGKKLPTAIKFPDLEQHGLNDATLIDLSIPALIDTYKPVASADPASALVSELPKGLWVTAKMLPVVVLWPKEEGEDKNSAPSLEGFGNESETISSWVSFCAPIDRGATNSIDFQVSALGLFHPYVASLRSRMMVTYETFTGNILKSLPVLEVDGLVVKFLYDIEKTLLDITIEAKNAQGGIQVYLPHSLITQIFIEKMADEIKSLGLGVQVEMGDGMLRYEGSQKTSVQ